MKTIQNNPEMPKLSETPADALEFLLERLDPKDSIERLVEQAPYDERRAERAYLLSELRRAKRILASLR